MTKTYCETGKGYWMNHNYAETLRAEGENRPSRPSHCIVRYYENHAQDSRVRRITDDCTPTIGSSNANSPGVSGNNPLILTCVMDMQGGKNGCNVSSGRDIVSPTITRGRASVNDIHLV